MDDKKLNPGYFVDFDNNFEPWRDWMHLLNTLICIDAQVMCFYFIFTVFTTVGFGKHLQLVGLSGSVLKNHWQNTAVEVLSDFCKKTYTFSLEVFFYERKIKFMCFTMLMT